MMAGAPPRHDWEVEFYKLAARPAHERSLRALAREMNVRPQTVTHRAKRDRWHQRLAEIDEVARRQREANAIRTLNERVEDNLRIVEAMRIRFAQRLRDPSYAPSAQEFFAMAKLELLLESRDTQKIGIGSISEEFKESLRRLPVYVKERMIVSYGTGEPIESVDELEPYIDEELDDDEGPAG